MQKFGSNQKRRFSLKHPDGTIHRYGTCNPKDVNDNMQLQMSANGPILFNHDTQLAEILPPGTLATHGYYDHEHTGWLTPEEFIKSCELKDNWISVKDRLPTIEDAPEDSKADNIVPVLFWASKRGEEVGGSEELGWFDLTTKKWMWSYYDASREFEDNPDMWWVTHWMVIRKPIHFPK